MRFDIQPRRHTAKDKADGEATLVYKAPVTQHLTDREIITALNRLSPPFQAVLLHALVEEFTYTESAQILQIGDVPVATRTQAADVQAN